VNAFATAGIALQLEFVALQRTVYIRSNAACSLRARKQLRQHSSCGNTAALKYPSLAWLGFTVARRAQTCVGVSVLRALRTSVCAHRSIRPKRAREIHGLPFDDTLTN
jgi:hypothetical protein